MKNTMTLLLAALLLMPTVVAIDQAIIEDGVLTWEELRIQPEFVVLGWHEPKEVGFEFFVPSIEKSESVVGDLLILYIDRTPIDIDMYADNVRLNGYQLSEHDYVSPGSAGAYTFPAEYLRLGQINKVEFIVEPWQDCNFKVYPSGISGFGPVVVLSDVSAATRAQAGETFKVAVRVRNSGKVVADSVSVALDLRTAFPVTPAQSVELYPGEEKEVVFNVRAPSKAGSYPLGYVVFNGERHDFGSISIEAQPVAEPTKPAYYDNGVVNSAAGEPADSQEGSPMTMYLIVGGASGVGIVLLLAAAAYFLLKRKKKGAKLK